MAKGYLYDNGDELISREDVNEVPEGSSAHAGDVLALDSNKKPKWTTPESGLPGTGTASAGDVLSLDEDKEPVWSTPSGGGGGLVISVDTSGDPISLGASYNGYPVNKTWNDVKNALESGTIPFIIVPQEGSVMPFFVTYVDDSEGLASYPYECRFVAGNVTGELSDTLLVSASPTGTMYYAFAEQN